MVECVYFHMKHLRPQKYYTFSSQTCFTLAFSLVKQIFLLFDWGTDLTFSVWGSLQLDCLVKIWRRCCWIQNSLQTNKVQRCVWLDRRQRSSSQRHDEDVEEELTSHSLDGRHHFTLPANGIDLILTIFTSHFFPFYPNSKVIHLLLLTSQQLINHFNV